MKLSKGMKSGLIVLCFFLVSVLINTALLYATSAPTKCLQGVVPKNFIAESLNVIHWDDSLIIILGFVCLVFGFVIVSKQISMPIKISTIGSYIFFLLIVEFIISWYLPACL